MDVAKKFAKVGVEVLMMFPDELVARICPLPRFVDPVPPLGIESALVRLSVPIQAVVAEKSEVEALPMLTMLPKVVEAEK